MVAVQARGLRRANAAAYLGISSSFFDMQRKLGNIPPPREIFGVQIYDRFELDEIFDGKPVKAANDNEIDYWDQACGINAQNT